MKRFDKSCSSSGPFHYFIILRWQYSPVRTFDPLMDFPQSAFFLPPFQIFNFASINVLFYYAK